MENPAAGVPVGPAPEVGVTVVLPADASGASSRSERAPDVSPPDAEEPCPEAVAPATTWVVAAAEPTAGEPGPP